MRKSILVSILFLVSYYSVAQSDYVVTLKSDTLRGEVRILSYDQIDRVQVSAKGRKEMFTALQVSIVSIDDSYHKAVQQENSVRLMKIIKSGYLTLYGFKQPNMSSYDGRFLVKLNGTTLEMPNIGFKKVMASFLEDCAEVSSQVKNGMLSKNDIEEIIDRYNLCVTKSKPAMETQALAIETTPEKTLQLDAVLRFADKIKELDFDAKQDVLDILRDIQSKVEKGESVSKYQLDGLQATLKDQPTVTEELNNLIALFKK